MGRIDIADSNIATAAGLYGSPRARECRQFLLRLGIAPPVWVLGGVAVWQLHAAVPMHFFLCLFVYLGAAMVLLAVSRRAYSPSLGRQLAGTVVDIGALVYLAMFAHGFGAVPLLLYAVVIGDTGIRFGRRALYASTALAVSAVALVAWLSPYWAGQWLLLASIVCVLIVVPHFLIKSGARRAAKIVHELRAHAVAEHASARVREVVGAALDIIGINADRLTNQSRLGKQQPQIAAIQSHVKAATAFLQDEANAGTTNADSTAQPWSPDRIGTHAAGDVNVTSDKELTPRVLLVTDNAASLHVIGKLLTARHMQLTVARTFNTAATLLTRAGRKGEPIHLILVDANATFGVHDPALAAQGLAGMLDEAGAVATPVYLFGEAQPTHPLLRAEHYAGVIAATAADVVAERVRASPVWVRQRLEGGVGVEPSAWQQQGLGSAQRILVVDDTKTNLLIVQSILDAAGYDADVMTHAIPALERLASGDYSLAIIDMHMPDMDGISLLKRYQLLAGARRKIPIVFLTADTRPDATRECAEAGADAFLNKPVRSESLLGTVETLLEADALRRRPGIADTGAGAVAPVDAARVRELARMFGGQTSIMSDFCREADALLLQLAHAAEAHDHPAFCDAANALRASAADVGAVALAAECHNAGGVDTAAFAREGAVISARISELYVASVSALTTVLSEDD